MSAAPATDRPIVAIVQARMGSSRLPGKVMKMIAGAPAIGYVLGRVGRAKLVDEVWLACADVAADDPLAAFAEREGFPVFRGSENDVLARFAAVARRTEARAIVRITGDCPMIDPAVIDLAVERWEAGGADFVSNTLQRSFPDGLDVEVFSRAALEHAHSESAHPFLREHVTPYIHGRLGDRFPSGQFTIAQVVHPANFSHLRWTLDGPDDLEFFRRLFPLLPQGFSWLDAVAALTHHPALMRVNSGHAINEGIQAALDAGKPRSYAASEALFARTVEIVPLASQTFSKSHEQWVKGASPLFIERGRGCRIWDVDGNVYIDHVLGLLPVVLGYRDPDVDAAIIEQLDKGIVFPLASPLEAELAERLKRLIPCAEMVRYGKNGSDATTAAIRLARACTGRNKVALCGYHGWHDWYIGTTTRKLGVPDAVQALSVALPFGDPDAAADAFAKEPNEFAAIILEPAGAKAPPAAYLQRLRELCDRYGVVLVFDEIVTGFRMGMGGAQAHYGVVPDLACFGKAMANGMPISAIVGRAALMRRMEDIFFSGTFGGEALSLAAAIATIDKLERENVPERLAALGTKLMTDANGLIAKHGLGEFLAVNGENWWPRFAISRPPVDAIVLQSLMRQEFVAQGILLGTSFNLCLAHEDPGVTDATLKALNRAFDAVRDALDAPDPAGRLRGRPIRPTFQVRPG